MVKNISTVDDQNSCKYPKSIFHVDDYLVVFLHVDGVILFPFIGLQSISLFTIILINDSFSALHTELIEIMKLNIENFVDRI